MRTTLTTSQAEARFDESLRLAERGEVVVITRDDRPVAALVGARNLDQLERLLSSDPQAGLAGLVGRWDDGDEFAAELDRLGARTVPE